MKTASATFVAFFAGAWAQEGEECLDGVCLDETVEDSALLQHKAQQRMGVESKAETETGAKWLATNFVPYFSYEGDLKVTGFITATCIKAHPTPETVGTTGQNMRWFLKGADPRCSMGPGNASNSCGVHIHEGTSCDEDALGHYYNDELAEDPWKPVGYTTYSDSGGARSTLVGRKVLTGLTAEEIDGHTMIVHDFDGGRIACAILGNPFSHGAEAGAGSDANEEALHPEAKSSSRGSALPLSYHVTDFVPYSGYTGDLEVKGSVTIKSILRATTPSLVGQILSWDLKGVDPACNFGPDFTYANSCGIHIHNAKDSYSPSDGDLCDFEVAGHAWNSTVIAIDPWAKYTYTVGAETEIAEEVHTEMCDQPCLDGLSMSTIGDGKHALIVHNFLGNRVACGNIGK